MTELELAPPGSTFSAGSSPVDPGLAGDDADSSEQHKNNLPLLNGVIVPVLLNILGTTLFLQLTSVLLPPHLRFVGENLCRLERLTALCPWLLNADAGGLEAMPVSWGCSQFSSCVRYRRFSRYSRCRQS